MFWITSHSWALEAGPCRGLHSAPLGSTSDYQAFWCSFGTLTFPFTSSQFLVIFRYLAGTCHPLRPGRSYMAAGRISMLRLVGFLCLRMNGLLPRLSVTMHLHCSPWKAPYVDREIFWGRRNTNQGTDGRMDQVEAPATKHSDLVELPRNQIRMEGEKGPHKVVL